MALRAAIPGHFALRLGSGAAADVTLLAGAFLGGTVDAPVVAEQTGNLHFPKKHLGPPRYEAVSIPLGLSMSQAVFDWIAGSWGAQPAKKDGAVLALDHGLNVKTETRFAGGLVTETAVPALDAGSKETALLTVKFQPEVITAQAAAGKLSLAASKQKLWRAANFRLEIDGLDCTKVSRIEGFTVRRAVTAFRSGTDPRDVTLVPGAVEFPELAITLAEVSAQSWRDWHKSFVVDGNNGEAFERSGALRFLAADLKTELSRIDLLHLGIVRVAPVHSQGAQLARVVATLYCEEMRLTRTGGGP